MWSSTVAALVRMRAPRAIRHRGVGRTHLSGSRGAGSRRARSAFCALLGVDKEVQHLADGPFPADRVAQWKMGLDVVAVAATVLLLHHIAGCSEVHHDPVRGALGDVERNGEVA